MSNYFFNELEPDNTFFLINNNPKVVNTNDNLNLFYKEYLDFINNLKDRKSLIFSTEELEKMHLRQLNQETFSKMSKLSSKYISAINTRINVVYPLLEYIQKASMNLELSKNLNQVRSLSDSKYKNIVIESIEPASDIIKRLDTMLSTLASLSDIKAILTDPVNKDKNVLGNVASSILNNLKSNKSFRYVQDQFNLNITCESALPYTRSSAVHDYLYNVSLEQAGYNNKTIFNIYKKLLNTSSSLENYFTKNYLDISSYYNNNYSYFEKLIKSLKETYFDKDNLPIEMSLPIRLTRLTSTIDVVTNTITPTLYKDIKYIIEIFSKLGSHETINTSCESFKCPSAQDKVNSLNDIHNKDFEYINTNYKKFLQSITNRAYTRIKELNNFFSDIPQKLYHCRKPDTQIYPMCIDEYNNRLSFYEVIFLGASKYLDPIISDINKNKLISDISIDNLNNITEYTNNIIKDSSSNLYTTIISNLNNITASTSYLDTLENESKVSLESMGYNQNNINDININGYRDSILKCHNTLQNLLSSIKEANLKKSDNLKNTQAPLYKVLILLANLFAQNKFEINFFDSLIDG